MAQMKDSQTYSQLLERMLDATETGLIHLQYQQEEDAAPSFKFVLGYNGLWTPQKEKDISDWKPSAQELLPSIDKLMDPYKIPSGRILLSTPVDTRASIDELERLIQRRFGELCQLYSRISHGLVNESKRPLGEM